MHAKPPRPQPSEKVLDYDDGDPYSCIAAGYQENQLQERLLQRVEECYGKPDSELAQLASADLASFKTALYDIWERERKTRHNPKLGTWAADQSGQLGNRSLISYDQSHPPGR